MKEIVLATAGHIDHGKTTLIKALTGIETDTSKEEKNRGLSINLGFAYLDLPNQRRVGIVDVPGHERFIKNMIAGLPGINLVLLVIDAAEGIMPQTKEHIDILTLLGVDQFMIVLTKISLVDAELKALVLEDIHEQFQGTPLQQAPIVETDAIDGLGLLKLMETIQEFAETCSDTSPKGTGRLNVDRVFSVKGFGTVVTGTLLDGSFSVGEELTIFPSGKKTRIRTIQVHEANKEIAYAGQRTALNLANLSTTEIERGDVLTTGEEQLTASWMLDVKVQYLTTNKLPLNLWDRVRLLIGTKEVFARVVPIGEEQILPGKEGFLQLRLEEQLAVKSGDSFILRQYSPMVTIGGGQVLDANPIKHKRFKQEIVERLKVREEGSLEQLILDFLNNLGKSIVSLDEIAAYTAEPIEKLRSLLDDLAEMKKIMALSRNSWIHYEKMTQFEAEFCEFLANYHQKNRLKTGVPISSIRSKFQAIFTIKEVDSLLEQLLQQKKLKKTDTFISLPNFVVTYNSYQLEAKKQIEAALLETGLVPTKIDSLITLHKNAQEVLEALEGKSLIFLTKDTVISQKSYIEVVDLIKSYGNKHKQITLAEFRDLTKTSRKAALLILEFMDKAGITKRVGDTRLILCGKETGH